MNEPKRPADQSATPTAASHSPSLSTASAHTAPIDAVAAHPTTAEAVLSGLEARCLCKCIDDCEHALQHALVGLEQVRARSHSSPRLAQIDAALQTAEREVCSARRLAQSGGPRP
jgi:hypothetical protein